MCHRFSAKSDILVLSLTTPHPKGHPPESDEQTLSLITPHPKGYPPESDE